MSGELEPGTQVNELAICEELGVSRTPLREALLRLEFEGFVDSQPGKGFIVTPLSAETAFELHSVVGLLEGLAVRTLAEHTDEELEKLADELESANRAIVEAASQEEIPDAERIIELGDAWHSTLVGAWENEQFHEVLALLKSRLYRYTYLFLRDREHLDQTLDYHHEIIDAIRNREIETAVRLLREHWMSGADARYDWLKEAEDSDDG